MSRIHTSTQKRKVGVGGGGGGGGGGEWVGIRNSSHRGRVSVREGGRMWMWQSGRGFELSSKYTELSGYPKGEKLTFYVGR